MLHFVIMLNEFMLPVLFFLQSSHAFRCSVMAVYVDVD